MIVETLAPTCKVTFGNGEGSYFRRAIPEFNAVSVINIDLEQIRGVFKGKGKMRKFKENVKQRGFDLSSMASLTKQVVLHEIAHYKQYIKWPEGMFDAVVTIKGAMDLYSERSADRYAFLVGRFI